MKKILSVLLAVCLLCTFPFVGSAVENDARANEFTDEFARMVIMTNSYYVGDKDYEIIEELVAYITEEFKKFEWFTDFDVFYVPGFLADNAENLSAYAADLKAANDSLEQYIEEKNYTVIVDESVLLTAYSDLLLFYGEDVLSDEHLEAHYDKAVLDAAVDDRNEAYDYLVSVSANPPADVQKTYDELVLPFTELLNNISLCESGTHVCSDYVAVDENAHKTVCTFCNIGEITSEHTWGEYKENADGSKSAVCEFCDATNVIPGETVEPEENIFARLLEKIKSFFDAIIAFLQSIFNL